MSNSCTEHSKPNLVKETTNVAQVNDFLLESILDFFQGGEGPSHGKLGDIFSEAGVPDGYKYDPDARGTTKQGRIRTAFSKLRRDPHGTKRLLQKIINLLRVHGDLSDLNAPRRIRLVEALAEDQWELSPTNILAEADTIVLATGDRDALAEQIRRLNESTDDPALLLGTAKELLEAIYKFVLEEAGIGYPKNGSFQHLQHLALDRLQMLPQQVDSSHPGGLELREIWEKAQSLAAKINDLRNLQGTGHGRTLPTGVTTEAARFVIKQGVLLGEMMLTKLDINTNNAKV